MGRPRIFRNADRYPFSDKNCSGGNANKGLRRQVKDGDITLMTAEVMVWGKASTERFMDWGRHERNNKFAQWLRRRKKRLKGKK